MLGEDESNGARLRHHGEPSGEWIETGKGGIHPNLGIGVHRTQAIQADDPNTVSAGRREKFSLDVGTRATRFREPRTDNHHRTRPGRSGLLDDAWYQSRWNRDDHEIDRLGQRRQPGVRRYATDCPRRRIDGVDSAREIPSQKGSNDLMAGAAETAPRPDNGDRTRTKDRCNAGNLGGRLPLLATSAVFRRRRQIDLDPDRVVFLKGCGTQASRPENFEHVGVLHHDLGNEALNGLRPRVSREALEQQRRYPVALVFIGDREGDSCGRIRGPETFIAPDRHDLIGHQGDERHPRAVVHLGTVRCLSGGDRRMDAEVTPIGCVRREVRVEVNEQVCVGRPDRTDEDRLAVRQQPVELPGGGVSRR